MKEPPLPRLLDTAGIMAALGVNRNAAEAIMRRIPKQLIPGLRKTYVREADLREFLDANMVDDRGFDLHDGRGRVVGRVEPIDGRLRRL